MTDEFTSDPPPEKFNYSLLLDQIEKSFDSEINLLSACGLCVLMDVLAQEYYFNMKVRADLGFPTFPNSLNQDQVEKMHVEFKMQKRGGNQKIFLWAFENMELILQDGAVGQPQKSIKFNHDDALKLYKFRCDMLHNLRSDEYEFVNFPRANGQRSRNLADFFAKPIVEVQGDKTLIRLPDLFQYLSEVTARLSLQAMFNGENMAWITLGQFLTLYDNGD